MSQKSDGMNYAPQGKPAPVVEPGEFVFAAAHLDHGHIFGQCNGLLEAGAELKWVYEPDPAKLQRIPGEVPRGEGRSVLDEILQDGSVKLVAAAAVPCDRGAIGCRVMEAGKDYFTDKTPFTAFDQFERGPAGRRGDRPQVHGLFQRAAPRRIGDVRDRPGPGRRHRPGDPGPRTRAAPAEPTVQAGLVLRAGQVRRYPLRHRQPPVRAVPDVFRGDRRDRRPRRGRQFRPSGRPGIRGLRRGFAPRRQRRHELHPGRLVHPSGTSDLGRRPDVHRRGPAATSSCANTSTSAGTLPATTSTSSTGRASTMSRSPARSASGSSAS